METDLDLTSDQYSIALVVFFIGYVVFEVPSKCVSMTPSGYSANMLGIVCSSVE